MAGYELATAYVSLAVESSEIAKQIGRGFAEGDKVAFRAGKSMGKALGDAFAKEKGPDFDKLAADAEKADKRVEESAKQTARKRAEAARQVEIAEQRLLETREKSIGRDKAVVAAEKDLAKARANGDADEVAKAEARLARARDEATPTAADMAAEDRLAKAKRGYIDTSRNGVEVLSRFRKEQEQANAKLEDARRAADKADDATDRAAGAFARLGDRVKTAMKGDFKDAFRRVEVDGQDAAREIERDFKRAGDDSARGFGSNFKMGLGAALGGLTAYFGLNELVDFGKFAFTGSADLEQSIGGVETVFKGSSDQMLAWSRQANKTLGLTANEYNEFSARLGASLKNAGTPMDELAGKTDWLITLGADLASLYGGDTTQAVDALSSALRGEMDPIERYGISLNAAALDAEGLALGMKKTGGAWSTQEKQLITMSLLQKQSADATGNFAREQDTASNIAQRFTAKIKDMVTGMGQKLLPILTTLGGWVMDHGIPALESFGSSIGGVFDLLATGDFKGGIFGLDGDSPFIGVLLDVRDAAMSVWQDALKPFGAWLVENKGVMADFAGGIATALGEVVSAVASVVTWIVDNQNWVAPLAAGIGAMALAWQAWTYAVIAWNLVMKAAAGFQAAFNLVMAANPIGLIVIALIGLVAAFVVAYQKSEWFRGVIDAVWSGIKTAIGAVVDWIGTYVWPVIQGVFDAVAGGAIWLWQNAILPAWEGVKVAIAVAIAAVMTYLDLLTWYWSNVLAPLAMWLWKNVIQPVWNGIQFAIGVVVTAVSLYIDGWVWLFKNVLAPVFTWLWKSVVEPVWGGIKSAINVVVGWFRDTVKPIFDATTKGIGDAFDTMKDAVGKAWDAIKNAAKAPIKFVVETIVRDGIVKNFNKIAGSFGVEKIDEKQFSLAFADGGVMPGWTPGRDVHHFTSPTGGNLHLSGGESIMRPEWTRAVGGPRAVEAMNARARRGQSFSTGGVFQGSHSYKGGGVLDWLAEKGGDVFEWTKDAAGFAADALTDPIGAFKKLLSGFIDGIPGGGLMLDLAKGVPTKIVDSIGDALSKTFGGGGSAEPVGAPPAGASRSLGYAQSVASSMGLRMTSFRRAGARTAGSGAVSLHSQGRAMDFSNSSGPTPQMMAFFDAMHPLKPTELLYSPAGPRQWNRSGRMGNTSGATHKMHFNHVHVGFKDGGVFGAPFLHDQGGWHEPGELSVNMTRKPEAVLTDQQWRTAADAVSHVTNEGASGVTIGQVYGLSAEDVAREIRKEERKRAALHVGRR